MGYNTMSDTPPKPLPPQPQPPSPFRDEEEAPQFTEYKPKSKRGMVLGLSITGAVVLVLALTGFFVWRYYTAGSFSPTKLTAQEKLLLEAKMEAIEDGEVPVDEGTVRELGGVPIDIPKEELTPAQLAELERIENIERRTLRLTERELNAMMNYNTGLGERVKVKFKPGRIDVGWIVPVDEEAPMIGGKTLRGSVDLSMDKLPDGRLSFAIEDVTVMGFPVPNVWLGDVKGRNLMDMMGQDSEFFRIFAAGIEHIEIDSGEIRVRLAE